MAQTHAAHTHDAHYFVPQPSIYPFILSGGMFLLALGFILQMNKFAAGPWIMLAGAAVILTVVTRWFGRIIHESQTGAYQAWEDKSFRYGMIWFILSEVAFFAAFFGALFYVRNISVPDLLTMLPRHDFTLYPEYKDLVWPASGQGPKAPAFTPMGAWGIPAINTALLLTSGATVTWAHWALLKNNRKQLNLGLFLTIALGVIFLCFQAYEYHHAYSELGLTLGAGVYGATFFMLTGFHGFHVTLGAIMLAVVYGRCLKGHFTSERHFAFEGVAWYWHFVDVVWLGLFIFVYWL
jgi:cytochrome c oxidase subunit 3